MFRGSDLMDLGSCRFRLISARMLNQNDFRKILATPRTTSGAKAPALFPSRAGRGGSSKGNQFKKPPPRIRREGRSDVLEHSHVDLGDGFIDRAKERRLSELHGEAQDTNEVKGLDFELLKKVRSGEFVLPEFKPPPAQRDSDDSDDEKKDEEEIDEEAILDELLQMEVELKSELEKAEKNDQKAAEEAPKVETTEGGPAADIPSAESTGSRFKPVVDAKLLKQARRERKRRKLAMEGMDRESKPMPPPPPPRKTRAELLEELRRIQAAKRQQQEALIVSEARISPVTKLSEENGIPSEPTVFNVSETTSTPLSDSQSINTVRETFVSEKSVAIEDKPAASTSIPREHSPRPPTPPQVKIGDNMFSDESELSDYNPYGNDSDDEITRSTSKRTEKSEQPTGKRNYFGDTPKNLEATPSGPITLDPTIAAALRKAAALADRKDIPEETEEQKPKIMSLSGSGGVYEFDEVDTWDGDDEEEIKMGKRKRKKK